MTPTKQLIAQLRSGDRRAIAKAITLLESQRRDDRERAEDLLAALLPHSGASLRIGISGIPGVGKSTLIEAMGEIVLQESETTRVAVLAVDPSSPFSHGSILGDKTRMPTLSGHARAFVRPSPNLTAGGGVSRRTREVILLMEACGFEVIIIETLGVGQGDFDIADMVDAMLLMHMPATGDEIQGAKKGILEFADLIVVNKADGDLQAQAHQAQRIFAGTGRQHDSGWETPVLLSSAQDPSLVQAVWEKIRQFEQHQKKCGDFANRRRKQNANWFTQELRAQVCDAVEQIMEAQPQLATQGDALIPRRVRSVVASLVHLR